MCHPLPLVPIAHDHGNCAKPTRPVRQEQNARPWFSNKVFDFRKVVFEKESRHTARSMAASLNGSSTISLRTSSPKGHEGVAV